MALVVLCVFILIFVMGGGAMAAQLKEMLSFPKDWGLTEWGKWRFCTC